MATWASKSFAFVSAGGYLDKLANVYPAPPPVPQSLNPKQYDTLKLALSQEDDTKLLKLLLSLKRFPFRDPYVGFLRENPNDINTNPYTVKRICTRLRNMGLAGVVKELEIPKEFNRQMGPLFKNWLHTQYPHTTDIITFTNSKAPLIVLGISGAKLRQFASSIGCGLHKEPDFIIKTNGKYVVGESKFVGTEGGHQDRSFDDAIALASSSFKQAVAVAVLDGIVWIPNSGQMSRRLANFGGNALSALLLDEFLNSV